MLCPWLLNFIAYSIFAYTKSAIRRGWRILRHFARYGDSKNNWKTEAPNFSFTFLISPSALVNNQMTFNWKYSLKISSPILVKHKKCERKILTVPKIIIHFTVTKFSLIVFSTHRKKKLFSFTFQFIIANKKGGKQ